MTRPLRLEKPDGLHHVVSRGINKQTIFFDRDDCQSFLLELRACVVRFEWRCLSYVLMGNHFHLLIQTPKANLGVGMRDLKSAYAFGLNRRHGASGPRFEGRYRSQLIQDGPYLKAAARYIALNPIRAELTRRPEDYEWSSFGSLRRGEPSTVVDHKTLLRRLEMTRDEFIALVDDGAGLPAFDPRTLIYGDRSFVREHAPRTPPKQPIERAAFDQSRPPLSKLMREMPEEIAIREARNTYHYTIREIAEAVGRSTETVRRRLRMWDVRT